MKTRALSGLLWFYAAWYAGSMTADLFGLSSAIAAIFATAAVAIIVGDPRRIIWKRLSASADTSQPA